MPPSFRKIPRSHRRLSTVTDVVFFPKVWDEVRDIVQVDAPILVEGRLDKTRGAPQISAQKASSLLVNGIAESDAYFADT